MIKLSGNSQYLFPFLSALILSLVLTPLIIKLAHRYKFLALPREDRWHKRPTALMGGIGIFLSVIVSTVLFVPFDTQTMGILIAVTVIFLLGLIDDLLHVSPQIKIIIQVCASLIAISFGIYVKIIPLIYIALPITILWMIGITNAFNIMDNIDGLAAGIAFVSALNIFFFGRIYGVPFCSNMAVILAGTSLGFLVFNFNPAKIFMGDSGSLFLGFTFSLITIIGTWKTVTNLIVTLIVPLTIMIIPIFDVSLVTFSRIGNRRAFYKGGKDHSSHRLVFLGLSEKKAVVFLISAGALLGATSILLSKANFIATVLVIVLVFLMTVFFGIFLGEQKVYGEGMGNIYRRSPVLHKVILYKKQILQIIVDVLLFVVAHIGSYLLRYEGVISQENAILIQESLPLIIVVKLGVFAIFQLYRGEWKYLGINELIKILKAAFVGSIISILCLVYFFRFAGYSRVVFILDFLMTLLLVCGFRIMIRIFLEYFATQKMNQKRNQGIPILILGAGNFGELVIREIKNNLGQKYNLVGLLDDSPEKMGKIIHGVSVLGGQSAFKHIAQKHQVKKLFIAILHPDKEKFADVIRACQDLDIEYEFIKPYIE